jgi:hypothetical protein
MSISIAGVLRQLSADEYPCEPNPASRGCVCRRVARGMRIARQQEARACIENF